MVLGSWSVDFDDEFFIIIIFFKNIRLVLFYTTLIHTMLYTIIIIFFRNIWVMFIELSLIWLCLSKPVSFSFDVTILCGL